jgi:hypothetical protein
MWLRNTLLLCGSNAPDANLPKDKAPPPGSLRHAAPKAQKAQKAQRDNSKDAEEHD